MIESKYSQVKKILWLILVANFAVAIAKVIMGTMINSASMTADGFHSLTDGTSNIIGLIGISIAAKPVDTDHPYGHRKFETLTGLGIVAMLVYLGLKIIAGAFQSFINPVVPEINNASLVVMIVTLIINIFVTTYEHKRGVELNSAILISDASHTKSDIYVTLGVIFTLIAVKSGAPVWVDPLASIVVAGFILHAAYEIFQTTSGILVDKAVVENELLEKIVLTHKSAMAVHKLRNRGTIDDMYIDMHVLTDPGMTLRELHQFSHEIEELIRKELNNDAQVIVHFEPATVAESKNWSKQTEELTTVNSAKSDA